MNSPWKSRRSEIRYILPSLLGAAALLTKQRPALKFVLPAMPTGLRAPPRPWAGMTARQKDQWMEQAVMPAMRALFREYDPQHFAQVRCSTCHGANARQVHFHMPNTLPALARWGTPEARGRSRYRNLVDDQLALDVSVAGNHLSATAKLSIEAREELDTITLDLSLIHISEPTRPY